MTTISVTDFGASSASEDNALAFARAARWMQGHPGATMVIPPGDYHITSALAQVGAAWISNHDGGFERKVGLVLHGLRDAHVSGDGARLLMHGQVVPIALRDCIGVRISGLAIDWPSPLHAWGEVVGGWAGFLDVRVRGGHPWRVVKERLVFQVDGRGEEMWGTYACDPQSLANLAGSGDHCGTAWGIPWVAEDRGEGIVRLNVHTPRVPPSGVPLILRHGDRKAPGIFADGCRDLVIEDVTVHQASGMGIICQRCQDVRLERVRVVPSNGRPFSTNHDAIHFVSCRGHVQVLDCTTSHHLDDALNCHGVYAPVKQVSGDRLLLGVSQQQGNLIAMPGERIALVDQKTFQIVSEHRVTERLALSGSALELTVDGAVHDRSGLVVENLEDRCDLTVRGCEFRDNRARSILATGGGRMIIEENTINCPGAAVLVSGDTTYWFESGATREIIVRNNRFERCTTHPGDWGEAMIVVKPLAAEISRPVHGRLEVSGNTVIGGGAVFADLKHVSEVQIVGNSGCGTVIRR